MEIKQLKSAISTLLAVLLVILSACGNGKAKTITIQSKSSESSVKVPKFNSDSAYHFISQQVAFGPRVPNSEAHKACGNFLVAKLAQYGAKIYTQEVELKGYNNVIYQSKNIIGSINPNHPNRIIICAHWDTRHVADHDPDPELMQKPIDGANDGASGVGVILELARLMQLQAPGVGIDFILFDAEDQGAPNFVQGNHQSDTWCLGSQYWARNPHKQNYKAKYGILLDMVGAEDAIFPREGYSMIYAPSVVEKVWNIAASLGYSYLFTQQRSYPVTDDHYFINTIAKIPCIDIIHYSPATAQGFGDFWHTHQDNMEVISKRTLFAVGDVLTHLIYQNP